MLKLSSQCKIFLNRGGRMLHAWKVGKVISHSCIDTRTLQWNFASFKKNFENKKFKIWAVESLKCKLGKLAKLILAIYRSIAMLDYSNILEGRAVYDKIKN